MAILYERIAKEQDLTKFRHWVKQLNDLLDAKDRRLQSKEETAE